MVDALVGFVVLGSLYLLIRWIVTRRDRLEEEEKRNALCQHRAATDQWLLEIQHRQRDARAVKAAHLRQERFDTKMKALATGFYVATFPYWFWKDQRDYRRAMRRAIEEQRAIEGWEWVDRDDLRQVDKERREFDPDSYDWEE